MWIHGTKKVLDRLKDQAKTPGEEETSIDLFAWHINLIKLNRRQSLVLMHNSSKYPIVLYGVRAKDFKRLHETIKQAIRLIWEKEDIKEQVIEDYIREAGPIKFSKSKNRSLVSHLNQLCYEIEFFQGGLDENQLIQTDLSVRLARRLAGTGNTFEHPNQMLYEQLEQFAGGNIW